MSNPSNTPRYLTIAEAADASSVTPKTVRRWIAAGLLPAVRLGPRVVRIREGELSALGQPLTVARVTALPRAFRLTAAERLILLTLACDSYEGDESSPSYAALAAWTGL